MNSTPASAKRGLERGEGITLEMRPALGFSVELLGTKDPYVQSETALGRDGP